MGTAKLNLSKDPQGGERGEKVKKKKGGRRKKELNLAGSRLTDVAFRQNKIFFLKWTNSKKKKKLTFVDG